MIVIVRLALAAILLAACGSSPPPKTETPAPAPVEPARPTTPPDRPPPIGVDPGQPEAPKPVETKPQPPRLSARAAFSSLIAEKSPTVTITVTNPEVYAVPIAKVTKPICWLALYTRAELTRPDGKESEMKPCKDDGKHAIEDLAPGATKTITLNVSELFGTLGLGQYSLNFDWDTTEAGKLDEKLVVFGKLEQRRRDFIVAKLLSTFSIAKGKTAPIDGKVKLLFVSHGHKSVSSTGPGSPLLINAEIVENGKGREVYASIHTEDKELVNLDGYIFDVVEYKYDESMKLRYWGKLQLAN